jgi:cytoplasmic iron level regulating protein YaaA (DUF328/UPF0246 family)
MAMKWGGEQFRFEYDQKLPGYSGELPEHWGHHVEQFDNKAKADAALARLHAYIEQQAENYPGEWVRNITPMQRRDVAYSEWA